MNPTLYDILGVPEDASRSEIRKAWREAAERFEPGEGGSTKQFRLFNQAAEVLLDAERRKEYDAQLAREAAPAEDAGAEPEDEAPAADESKSEKPSVPTAKTPSSAGTGVTIEPEPSVTAGTSQRGRTLGWPVLAVLGALAAVAVGFAAYFVTQAERAEAYQDAVDRAPAAAESAAAAVLSYDYKSLEADRDTAAKFLSDDYRSKYVDTFDKLVSENASKTKATVEAQVLASSAMAVGEDRDPDRVPVLLFVNQTTTSSATTGQPSVALNRVRFDMVDVDGTWLVDDITSY